MKIRIFPIILLLSACTPLPLYTPKLATPPADQAKFEADVSDCKGEVLSAAMHRASSTSAMEGFGALGGLAQDISTPRQPEPYILVNRCLQAKGYKILGDGR